MFLHQALPKDIQGTKRQLYQINRKSSPKHQKDLQPISLKTPRKKQPESLERSRSNSIKSTQKPKINPIHLTQIPSSKQINAVCLRRNPDTPEVKIKFNQTDQLIFSQRVERQSYEGNFSVEPPLILCKIENKAAKPNHSGFSYIDLSSIGRSYLLRYEGETIGNRMRHGFGTQWFSNGQKFVGTFENDQAHGHGTYYGLRKKVMGWWERNHLKQVFVQI